MNRNYLKKPFAGGAISIIKSIIGFSVILFMTNLNAIVDLILHPDIPYFDSEHLIVGSISCLVSSLFIIILYLYLNHIDKTNIKQIELINELQEEKEKFKESEARLKKLNATKDKLFSIIAHDLKNPFNTILGFSELLSNNIRNYDFEKSEKFSKQIQVSTNQAIVLLDNLLAWAKTQTGNIIFKPEKLNLLSVIQGIEDVLNSSAKIKGISLNYFQSEDIEVYADSNMLQIILRNLISNAIKFSNTGGTINIYVEQDHDLIEVTIADNGIGIDKDGQNKLFRIENNYTTIGTANEKGSGLGLILCKEFVEMHNGKIWVESELAKGAEFKFTLPLYISARIDTLDNEAYVKTA